MQDTTPAFTVRGPSGPPTPSEAAATSLNAGSWQPWQRTPVAYIVLGM